MTDLDDRLRQHYRGAKMSESVFAELAAEPVQRPVRVRLLSKVQAALSVSALQAGLGMFLLGSVAFIAQYYSAGANETDRTRQEVALNHSTRFEVEFEDVSLEKINQQMDLLPFDLALPEGVLEKHNVVGARYCSLNGQLAAHVKMIDKDSKRSFSVFLTSAAEDLESVAESEKTIDGFNVRIWRDSGLLYASAGS